jgi:hypothetical protein
MQHRIPNLSIKVTNQIDIRFDLRCFRINVFIHTPLPLLPDYRSFLGVPRTNIALKDIWHADEPLRQPAWVNWNSISIPEFVGNLETPQHPRHSQKQ